MLGFRWGEDGAQLGLGRECQASQAAHTPGCEPPLAWQGRPANSSPMIARPPTHLPTDLLRLEAAARCSPTHPPPTAHPHTRTLGLSCNGPLRARFMYSTAGAPATSASGAVKNSLEPGAARGIEPCQGLASGLELRPAGPPPAPRGRWKAAWRLGAAAVCTLADLQQQSDNTAADGAGMPFTHASLTVASRRAIRGRLRCRPRRGNDGFGIMAGSGVQHAGRQLAAQVEIIPCAKPANWHRHSR